MLIRLLLVLALAISVTASDLTTFLQIGASSPSGLPLTCQWQTVAKADGAGDPLFVVDAHPETGYTNRVRVTLPNAQVGFYEFQAVVSDGRNVVASDPVTVVVRANTLSVANGGDSGSGGSGGCGLGGGMALILCGLCALWRQRDQG